MARIILCALACVLLRLFILIALFTRPPQRPAPPRPREGDDGDDPFWR